MAERRTGFTIEIKGTKEQQQKLGLLTGELLRTTKRTAEFKKAALASGGANTQLNKKLSDSRLRQKNLSKQINQTTRSIQDQSGKFKKSAGLFTSVNKAVSNSFKQVGIAIGVAFGARALLGVVGGAINIFKDFQQGQADLAAVLGRSRSEITGLTADAKRLGATTVFTASEVSSLQKEFAKLGFSTAEIRNATQATLDLAAATGADLAQAATVAGATVRGFGLNANETQRVVDVMAKSFSSSALDIGKFQVAMGNVAPVAKAAGLTIEETTAFLGILTDRGIDASKAGTDLRNIFLELSKQGLTLDEALDKIRNSTDKNSTALQLFGKRGSTSALIMAENSDAAAILTSKLENAGGAAERMAEEQLDTLTGQTKLLNSAWEGFVLSLESGDGVIGKLIGGIVKFSTGLLNLVTSTEKHEKAVSEEVLTLQKEQAAFNDEIAVLKNANLSQEERRKVIDKINIQFGKYLPNLISEKNTLEDLEEAQRAFNSQILKRIILAEQQEKLAELAKRQLSLTKLNLAERREEGKLIAQRNKLIEKQDNLTGANFKSAELLRLEDERLTAAIVELDEKIAANNKNQEFSKTFADDASASMILLRKEYEKLAGFLGVDLTEAQDDANKAIEGGSDKAIKAAAKLAKVTAEIFKQAEEARIAQIEDATQQRIAKAELDFEQEINKLTEQKLAIQELDGVSAIEKADQQAEIDTLIEEKEQLHQDNVNQIAIDGAKTRTDAETEQAQNLAQAQQAIQDVRLSGARAITSALSSLAGESIAAQAGFLAVEKGLAIAQVIINLQREISAAAAAAAANPLNIITAGAAGVTQLATLTLLANTRAGINIGIIAAQAISTAAKFAKGGILEGASHRDGGIPFSIDGRGGFEAEGGEVLLNKNVSKSPSGLRMASNLNQAFGGKKFFQGGGIFTPQNILPRAISESSVLTEGSISREEAVELITEGINAQQITVTESDITETQARVAEIESD